MTFKETLFARDAHCFITAIELADFEGTSEYVQ